MEFFYSSNHKTQKIFFYIICIIHSLWPCLQNFHFFMKPVQSYKLNLTYKYLQYSHYSLIWTQMDKILKAAFVSILQSQDMSDLYVLKPEENSSNNYNQSIENLTIEQQKPEPQISDVDQNRNLISRLQIEIKKYKLDFVPLAGQNFLLSFKAHLLGKISNEEGLLMMTNYRIIFFKGQNKRVDLPFGLISNIKMNDKIYEITFQLKYPHNWKFQLVSNLSKLHIFKTFITTYFRPNQIRNNFSFEFRLKSPIHYNSSEFNINSEYLKFKSKYPHFTNRFELLKNDNFQISYTYTELVYTANVPVYLNIEALTKHRKLNRLPILAYLYTGCGNNNGLPVWISSSYEDMKNINKTLQTSFLKALSKESPVQVFICQGKSKNPEQSHFSVIFSANYLDLESNQQLSKSESSLIQVFLQKKTPIIKQILNSKWYHYISRCLEACQLIRNSILSQRPVLIRCQQGRDKSLLLSALLQVILDPSYRTIAGFQVLVMKMFIHFGHPFATRLGQRNQCKQKCPVFLQFLDCLSQLINQNENSFEYNVKYLSSLANLMQLNIYGTFIADSPKEYIQNKVQYQTYPIWIALKSNLNINSNYVKTSGVLNFSCSLSNLNFWKEYFGALIAKKRDHYKFSQQAEDNQDYIKLRSNALKSENEELICKLKEYKLLVQKLSQKFKQ